MLAMCSELCKHYPAVQCTDNAVRSALHIALRRMQLCTVVHCTENAWCARDRKWRRGVRAVASWTPARAQLAHCVLISFCTSCATFSWQYQGLAHCCAVIETRHLRRFNRRHFERASIRACAESVSERLKGGRERGGWRCRTCRTCWASRRGVRATQVWAEF